MVGFKITHKGSFTQIGIQKGVTSLIFTRVLQEDRDELDLYAGGLDNDINRHVKWFMKNLELGDKITIEVQEFESPTKPQEISEEEPEEIVLKAKLRSYKGLKKELEDKGLI